MALVTRHFLGLGLTPSLEGIANGHLGTLDLGQ